MRISLISLLLVLGLIHPVYMAISGLFEDLEGSGYDLEASGSGDGSEKGETNIEDQSKSSKNGRIFAPNAGGGTENTLHRSSVRIFDKNYWPGEDRGSGFVVMANSKGFLEREDVFAGVIAGGVTGAVLAAALAGILIYKWQKKDDGGYILSQQRASYEDYHRHNRDEVVV
ncbi:uncharacterized protein ABDE67_017180 [Symphorus nematophorus]